MDGSENTEDFMKVYNKTQCVHYVDSWKIHEAGNNGESFYVSNGASNAEMELYRFFRTQFQLALAIFNASVDV